LAGDWNGNGTDTVGLYHPKTGTFYLTNSNTNGEADITFRLGPKNANGLKPLSGNWDGDGVDSVGLFNTATSTFYLKNALSTGKAETIVNLETDGFDNLRPISGDWNNGGIDTVGLFIQDKTSASNNRFLLKDNHNSGATDIEIDAPYVVTEGLLPVFPISGNRDRI